MPACHAEDRGSIPRSGFFSCFNSLVIISITLQTSDPSVCSVSGSTMAVRLLAKQETGVRFPVLELFLLVCLSCGGAQASCV